MSENTILGRKRTADGTRLEIRAMGRDADELTHYVQALLDCADIACASLRARRVALARLQASWRGLPCPTCKGQAIHDSKCPVLLDMNERAQCEAMGGCSSCCRPTSCAVLWPNQRKCCPDCTCAEPRTGETQRPDGAQ